MDEYVGESLLFFKLNTPSLNWLHIVELLKGVLTDVWLKTHPGLPKKHPESYHSFMWNNFFKHIDIKAKNAHILDGNATDLQAECEAFERKITAAGGIELFVGGQEVTPLLMNDNQPHIVDLSSVAFKQQHI